MVTMLSDEERYQLETAISDRHLCDRLSKSKWLSNVDFQMPAWLDSTTILGLPSLIPRERIVELNDFNVLPETANEIRLLRNKTAIKQVADSIETAQAIDLRATVLAPFYQRIEEDYNTIVQLRQEVADLRAAVDLKQPELLHVMVNGERDQALVHIVEDHVVVPHNTKVTSLIKGGVQDELTTTDSIKESAPAQHIIEQQALSVDDIEEQLQSSLHAESTSCHNEHSPSSARIVEQRTEVLANDEHIRDSARITDSLPRISKRKVTTLFELNVQEDRHLEVGRIFDQTLASLAVRVREEVRKPLPTDPIETCGAGPLSILLERPRDALTLAHKNLHSTTPNEVHPCWRRLYEDATLHLVAQLLHNQSLQAQPAKNTAKRLKITDGADSGSWLHDVVGQLDQAIIIAGAPRRRALIDSVFAELDPIAQRTLQNRDSQPLVRGLPPRPLITGFGIMRPKIVMTMSAFSKYVDKTGNAVRPLVLQGVMAEWPAMELWQDLMYLKRHTMAGHRLVPVEIGQSYTEPGWGQEIINFSEFADRFLVPDEPPQIGYLAQYDIFHQMPALKSDIVVPDYCYSVPPAPTGAAARTKGLDSVQELDEPLLNAWLGPKGTKSPLHTDPYHNILCQVVGYKYVRLYAPEQSAKLYPMETDEAGIEMGNTSEVDISNIRPRGYISSDLVAMRAEMRRKFPLLEHAKYEEAVLAPGESLYIPLGWWHYVESLTTSISVSFWWN